MKKLVLSLLMLVGISVLCLAANNTVPGPNNGQITVANSSTVITPTDFPTRYSITFLNSSSTITIYICKATQPRTLTLKTCSSSVADIVLSPGTSYSEPTNGYTGQFTAITSSSTQTLIISEN